MATVRIDLEMLPTIISQFLVSRPMDFDHSRGRGMPAGDSTRQFREIYIVQLVINVRRMLG